MTLMEDSETNCFIQLRIPEEFLDDEALMYELSSVSCNGAESILNSRIEKAWKASNPSN
jgi:hypothetical protein